MARPRRFSPGPRSSTPAPPPRDLAHLPRPFLGYVGSLEDRVDWELMDKLSTGFPEASIVVVGRLRDAVAEPWWEACSRFLSRPNVHALGWRPQEAVARYFQSFDVCLIPYRIDHPFNRACNPTKIMDAMGSGRPIVATALPECRLHAERFHVLENDEEFTSAVRTILAHHSDDGRWEFAMPTPWPILAMASVERILDLIDLAQPRRSSIDAPPRRSRQNRQALTALRAEADGNRRCQAVESRPYCRRLQRVPKAVGSHFGQACPGRPMMHSIHDPETSTHEPAAMNSAIRIKLIVMMFLGVCDLGRMVPALE